MFVWYSVVYWDSLGNKPLSKMGFICTSTAWCFLLHCSLMDLTLANNTECDLWSNSTWTWDLLSITAVRQATLHYTPLFISVCWAAMHHQKKYAAKSSLTHAKHQVTLQSLKRFSPSLSEPFLLFLALLKGLLIYISGFHILLCYYSFLSVKDVPGYMIQIQKLHEPEITYCSVGLSFVFHCSQIASCLQSLSSL